MSRLTENYYDEFGIKHTKLKDNIGRKTFRSYTWTPQEIANEKLAEFEDFLDKYNIKCVSDLANKLIESQNDYLLLEEQLKNANDWSREFQEENEQLKEKLAESESRFQAHKQTDAKTIQDQTDLIDNLKQKLAEYEKFMKDNEWNSIEEMQETLNKCEKKYVDMQQKLAEKNKEIDELKEQRHIYLNRSVEECNKITDLEFELQHKNQDKISFTIEQLEKVKEFFLEEHRDEEMDTDYIITKDAGEIADYLLNQIKQLKEGK